MRGKLLGVWGHGLVSRWWHQVHAHGQFAKTQVGVGFVIPEQDVETRVQRFDEVVFQQQRFGFRAHHGGFHAHDATDHLPNASAVEVSAEVAGHPLFQVACLAHVQHRTC
jgi:hypothetical protein